MQTFLPYASFEKTAKILDYKRLGKQRSETWIALEGVESGNGWKHHPVVKMWMHYPMALRHYYNAILVEWISRGYANNMPILETSRKYELPHWLGNKKLHISHRSNLLRKYPEYYRSFWPRTADSAPYFWPSGELY